MRVKFLAVILLAAVGFGGCGGKEPGGVEGSGAENSGAENSDAEQKRTDADEAEAEGTDESAAESSREYHTGSMVSRAYVDPDQASAAKEDLKATGFEYDRESLTWELVWSDEFDYEGGPDPEKWSYETGAGGWGNHELQNYTKGENVTVADGVMTIELRKEESGQYTSTRLVSRKKGDWTYCKVEASLKLPSGLGTWPAFWMMPTDSAYGTWPKSGEIDIMEHVGYDQDVIVETVHTEKYHGGQGKGKSFPTEGVSEEFHTYGVEWLPDKMIFSIDGEEKFTYDPHNYSSAPTKEIWPFDRDFYLIFNLAFGGDWGGARGTDDSYFPAEYYVDYVRVYQSPEIAELVEAGE
ncbi:MAG: glycoside hydrolase family 16 protein [Roseburia sp.]|nr:glycoside hydrolase family 16 protein [Roseburia sp.]MCM1099468.1 glycoside hydrolase family 16 protein [Ruminococcus flavefaciens]